LLIAIVGKLLKEFFCLAIEGYAVGKTSWENFGNCKRLFIENCRVEKR